MSLLARLVIWQVYCYPVDKLGYSTSFWMQEMWEKQMEESQVKTHQFDQQDLEQPFSPSGSPDSPSLELTNTQDTLEQEQIVVDRPDVEASAQEPGVMQGIQALFAEMESLRRDFDTKVKYDASKEHTIDSLHRELQFHREGLHFRILRPLFTDLIMLYDDMAKLLESISVNATVGSDQLAQMMQHLKVFQEAIEETLRRNGAEPFMTEGELFLPNRQRSVKVIPTADPALDKHIARRVRHGFAYEDKLLRHELVDVYKFMLVSE